MRISVAVAVACLSMAGLSAADEVSAAIRKSTSIPAQGLGPALKSLAKDRGFQIVYVSHEVNALSTQGATGELTTEEALMRLLNGTGLTYRIFGDSSVSIVPAISSSAPANPERATTSSLRGASDAQGYATTEEASSDRIRLAQSDQAASPQTQGSSSARPSVENTIDTITVTGSRIQRGGFEAPTPVTVVDAADFESRSTTNVADYLNDLPAFLPTATPTTNTIATGGVGNFLNLRALGGERTLVLVDGRRHVPTSSVGTVSINMIPALLIERVEVVTGGASAAYGSDAVAGVVNLIFDHDLQGLRGEVQSGMAEEGDNEEWRAALAFGTSFAGDRGHFSIAAEAFDNSGIQYQRDRDWGARDWGIILNPDYAPGNGEPLKRLVPDAGLTIASEGGLILSGSLAGMQFAPDGSLIPFNPGRAAGGLVGQGGDGPYAGEQAVLAVPLKRHNVFARARYDLTDSLTGYFEASYAEQESNNRNLVQPFNFGDLFIRADNAFLSPEVRSQLAGEPGFVFSRLNTDFGFVQANDKVETQRAVAGLTGQFGGGWSWDAYVQYGETDRANVDPGNVIVANLAQAVDAMIDPTTGDPVCRSGAAGCVPINLFGFGAPSQAALDYVHGTASVYTYVEQEVAAASVQGAPFDTWAGPLSVAFGAEYREDSVRTTVDEISLRNGFLIGNQKPVEGSIDVKEVFGEAVVPLLSDLPWAKRVEIDLAARLTDYSTSGSVTTWKSGLSYSVNDALRFRATRSRDIRAPNVFELYTSSGTGFWPVMDPVTGQSLLVRSTLLPNLDLQPEEADTTVIGIVLQPAFIPGFRFSADHFDIKLNDAISQLTPPDILKRCNDGAAELCDFIQRDVSGSIIAINRSQLNIARRRIRGVDFEAQYSLPLSNFGTQASGVLAFRLLATYTSEISYDGGDGKIDQAGALAGEGSLPGLPRWRGYGSISYSDGPLITNLGARFVGSAARDNTDLPLDIEPSHFPAQVYLEASVQYSLVNAPGRKIQLFGGATNLLDKDPVLTGRDVFFSAATNPLYYDVIGRAYNAGVRVQF